MKTNNFTLINFFKDGISKGLICYSKEWLDVISKLSQHQILELKIFLLSVSEGVKIEGGKRTYTTKNGYSFRYVDVTPEGGSKKTINVPEFPGFDEFICQIHVKTVDLSFDEITKYAEKLKASAEMEETKEELEIEIVKSKSKTIKVDKDNNDAEMIKASSEEEVAKKELAKEILKSESETTTVDKV